MITTAPPVVTITVVVAVQALIVVNVNVGLGSQTPDGKRWFTLT